MKTEKIEKTITLTDSISAKIVLSREGQQNPEDGDRVKVRGELHFPVYSPTSYLPREISFGQRLEVVQEKLTPSWGRFEDKTKTRVKVHTFTSPTWKASFQEAMKYFEEEVQKLVDALEARKQALVDAEE